MSKKKLKNNKNYCSKQCYYNSLIKPQHIRRCLQCKQDFVLRNIAYEKRGHGKYCSMQCSKYATKKYLFDETFFDEIDTEAKAYWLGFCMADGCNTGDELRVELSVKDECQLLQMKKDFHAEHPISYRNRGKHKMAWLGLSSRYLCLRLMELGCTPNKTFTLQKPSIPKILMRDFIRGYFDGDGCIYIHPTKGQKTWSIFGVSKEFLLDLKTEIENAINIKPSFYTRKTGGNLIVIRKKNDIQKLYHYLYDDVLVYMERKRDKFNPPQTSP